MNIELKAIKVLMSASEETFCYTATIYLDKKAIATVRNSGKGDSDLIDCLPGKSAQLAALHEHFAKLPPTTETMGTYTFDLQPSLEVWCGTQVANEVARKDMKKCLTRHALFVENGKLHAQKIKASYDLSMVCNAFLKKYPERIYLNLLSEADALVLYLKHGEPC